MLIQDETSLKKRHRLRGPAVATVALLVGGLLGAVGTAQPVDASCAFFKSGESAPESARAKKCGSGAGRPAPVAGGSIAVPRGSATAGALTRPFGTIGRVGGTVTATVLVAKAHHIAVNLDLPWPSRHSRTARRHAKTRYGIYQIYFRSQAMKKVDAYKYGITRAGATRPKSQLRTCANDYRTATLRCHYRWVRRNVVGFYRARVIETMYCARYVMKVGRRPYGMPKCL